MTEDVLKGKWKSLKGEAKIWWGHNTGDPLTELEGNKDKISGWLQEHKGMTQVAVDKEMDKLADAKNAMERKSDETMQKVKAQFDKLTDYDIADIDGDVEAWADKVKEKYNASQEEANAKIKDFMSQFK